MARLVLVVLLAASASAQTLSTRVDDLVRQEMGANKIEAVSVVLIDHNRIVYSQDFNTPADTTYRVGSVSKLFTDIAVMRLVEERQLDLDVPVTRYIPEFKHPVTLRQLMSHRSGLVREPPVGHYFDDTRPSLRETVLSLNQTELVYQPGTRYKYSNAGITVVGYVLERTQKQPFAPYLKQAVLDPLGLTNSSFAPRPAAKATMWTLDGRTFDAPSFPLGMSPAGSLYSTPADLAKFAQWLLTRDPILEKMWSQELGFRVTRLDGKRIVGHGGAIYGFATELEAMPDDGLAAIAVANKDGVNRVVQGIATQSLRWMLGGTDAPQLAKLPTLPASTAAFEMTPPAPISSSLAPFIGEYGWDYNTLYIHQRNGKLASLIEWFFLDTLDPIGHDRFCFPDSGLYAGESATFLRDKKDQITGVRIGGVLFPRRPDPAAPGVTFRLKPVRPMADLLRDALAAEPPAQPADLHEPDLIELTTLDPRIHLDIRYASNNNFLSTPFYSQARAFLQRPAAEATLRAARKLNELGYGLLIHDAYRPWFVTRMFWDGTPVDKHNFVADPSHGSRHNRGCAVDLTLYNLATGQPLRMTGGYDEMSTRSYPYYPGGTDLERWNRELLRKYMEAEGFQVYEFEWWHFDYKDWPKYPVLNKRFEDL